MQVSIVNWNIKLFGRGCKKGSNMKAYFLRAKKSVHVRQLFIFRFAHDYDPSKNEDTDESSRK